MKDVVAGAEEGDVVAVVAEHEVLAVATEQHIRALAAEQGVVAGTAVERELDDAGRHRRGGDAVIAGESCYHEMIQGSLGVGDVHGCRQADD